MRETIYFVIMLKITLPTHIMSQQSRIQHPKPPPWHVRGTVVPKAQKSGRRFRGAAAGFCSQIEYKTNPALLQDSNCWREETLFRDRLRAPLRGLPGLQFCHSRLKFSEECTTWVWVKCHWFLPILPCRRFFVWSVLRLQSPKAPNEAGGARGSFSISSFIGRALYRVSFLAPLFPRFFSLNSKRPQALFY